MTDLSATPRLPEIGGDEENDTSGFPRFLDFYRAYRKAQLQDTILSAAKELNMLLDCREDAGSSASAP